MKYEYNTKVKRNTLVIQTFKEHPELALQEIAELFNISKQRIYQILKRAGVKSDNDLLKNKRR